MKYSCLVILLMTMKGIASFGQENIGTLEVYGSADPEVFFMGDTMLIRMTWGQQATAKTQSTGTWYSGNTKIGEVDLVAFGHKNLIAVKKYADSIYYYTADDAGKKINVETHVSGGITTPAQVANTTVPGILVNAIHRGSDLVIITWERKATTIHLYWLNRGKLVNTRDLKLPKDLVEIREKDIAFIGNGDQSRISASASPLKIFFFEDTFGAVYDDCWREYSTVEKPGYKTRIFRKNLVTNKEDNDLFFTPDRYAFKSYLTGKNGKDLYRLVTTKNDVTLFVHDLDSNRVVMQHKIVASPNNVAFYRSGAEHKIEEGREPDLTGFMATDNLDIGIIADDYKGEQIITYGAYNNVKGVGVAASPNPLIGLATFLVVTAVKQMKDDPNNIQYQYLQGTPQTGFKILPVGEARDFIKTRIDEFELQIEKNGNVDGLAYFASDKYWIAIYHYKRTSVYRITKFAINP
jgi:hypothetical protein